MRPWPRSRSMPQATEGSHGASGARVEVSGRVGQLPPLVVAALEPGWLAVADEVLSE